MACTPIPRGAPDAELLYHHEVLGKPAFIPRAGDRVEFRSDRQTEKGPSSGSVIAVDRDARTATIRHSDHPGETFRWHDLEVEYVRLGSPAFWALV